ncbi:MAG TPA: DUF4136 domain-containing protein [bacterium]|nr:DUF4136 domain-containing protein [bacterium]
MATIDGRISTEMYTKPSNKNTFVVVTPSFPSLTEKQIATLIEKKMIEKGFSKASSKKTADIGVFYSYSIGNGSNQILSTPDFVVGGHAIYSETVYPRFFQIVIIDLAKTRLPNKIAIIWQGELRSKGSSDNIIDVAQYFIGALFSSYGKTVTNKGFLRIAPPF